MSHPTVTSMPWTTLLILHFSCPKAGAMLANYLKVHEAPRLKIQKNTCEQICEKTCDRLVGVNWKLHQMHPRKFLTVIFPLCIRIDKCNVLGILIIDDTAEDSIHRSRADRGNCKYSRGHLILPSFCLFVFVFTSQLSFNSSLWNWSLTISSLGISFNNLHQETAIISCPSPTCNQRNLYQI